MSIKSHFLFVILILFFLLQSCGKKVNHHDSSVFSQAESNHLLMEKKCAKNQQTFEPVTLEIVKFYTDFSTRFPLSFVNIPMSTYNFRSPLIVSMKEQEIKFLKLKEKEINGTFLISEIDEIAKEISALYHSSMRFEGQKCTFPQIEKKQRYDVLPYLEMRDFCLEKEHAEICQSLSFIGLDQKEREFVRQNTVKLCEAFDSRGANCQELFEFNRKNRTLDKMVTYYQSRFQSEHYNKLFKLKPKSQRFSCSKTDVIEMTVKVMKGNWDQQKLLLLTEFVESTWSKNGFVLSIDIVEEKGSDVVEIIPTSSGVSYVPDNDPLKVYLSKLLDFETQKRVLAHEFGHVLGFPDCYIEFFNQKNRSLVYYELQSGATNIMCSLKDGTHVPDTYIQELTQKSCVFH